MGRRRLGEGEASGGGVARSGFAHRALVEPKVEVAKEVESCEGVVLVDADLRRSTLSQRCGFDANPGLGDVFLGRSSIDDALVDCNPTLRFLPAGTTPPNAASVAESDRVAEIFRALAVDAEFVIVDTPPAVAVSEGAVLAATLDGTVVVVRENQTARASLEELQRRIEAVGGDVFATVLNAGRNARTEYEYGRSGYSKQGGRR